MKELVEYRKQLINRLADAAVRFREACLAVKDPHAPFETGGWSVHQMAVHVRDVHTLVYGARTHRTTAEDNPEFPNFDGDAYMAAHYDKDESLEFLLTRFIEEVETFTATLRSLPLEAWSRESRHAIMGSGFTTQTWVERDLAHIEEHIKTLTKGK